MHARTGLAGAAHASSIDEKGLKYPLPPRLVRVLLVVDLELHHVFKALVLERLGDCFSRIIFP